MQARIYQIKQILHHYGWRWVAFRLRHSFRLRTGYFSHRTPSRPWRNIPWQEWCADETLNQHESYLEWRRAKAPPFLFSANEFPKRVDPFGEWDTHSEGMGAPEAADKIHAGIFPHYTIHWLEHGNSPDWFINPFTGERGDQTTHWSTIADRGFGDIKNIWELSRFAWVYPLVRAYARDRDERHAETFWSLLEDWLEKNPPNTGVNWMCGQEISIRLMAWVSGLYAFVDTSAVTPARMQRLAIGVAESARRVEANLAYALSQRNNHGITECAGLITAGLLFPEIKGAKRWQAIGLQQLKNLVRELFYPDGSFSQHSPNYERLALQTLIWVNQLLEKNGAGSHGWLRSAIGRGGRFLFEICQVTTGEAPNMGGNDGALLLPLNNCRYNDFRPVIQAGMALGGGGLGESHPSADEQNNLFPEGPWDEDLFWLGIEKPSKAGVPACPSPTFDASGGGIHTLRSGDWTVIAHAPEFRHRPAHADLLHVDLWWKGIPIAVDAGTHSYRALPPFGKSFKTTEFHNTVEVDGISQMEPAGRFMLLPWARAKLLERGETKSGNCRWMVLEHDAYKRLKYPVTHQRAIIVEEGFVAIVDRLEGEAVHRYRLQWLLTSPTLEWKSGGERLLFEVVASGDDGKLDSVTGDHGSARGWQSRHYMEKEAANSIVMESTGNEVVFVSVFSKDRIRVELNRETRKSLIGALEVEFSNDSIHIDSIG